MPRKKNQKNYADYDPDVAQIASKTHQLSSDWLCTGRYFVREGSDIWQWNQQKWKKRYFVLFSDCIFLCREKTGKKYDLIMLIWFEKLRTLPKPLPSKMPLHGIQSSAPAIKDLVQWQLTEDQRAVFLTDFTWLNDVSLAMKALQATKGETLPPIQLNWQGFFFFFFFLFLSFSFFFLFRFHPPFFFPLFSFFFKYTFLILLHFFFQPKKKKKKNRKFTC